jgi:hypothetical protein
MPSTGLPLNQLLFPASFTPSRPHSLGAFTYNSSCSSSAGYFCLSSRTCILIVILPSLLRLSLRPSVNTFRPKVLCNTIHISRSFQNAPYIPTQLYSRLCRLDLLPGAVHHRPELSISILKTDMVFFANGAMSSALSSDARQLCHHNVEHLRPENTDLQLRLCQRWLTQRN